MVAQYGGKAGWAVVHQKENVLYLTTGQAAYVLEQTAGLLADQYQTDMFVYTALMKICLIQWLPLIHETRT